MLQVVVVILAALAIAVTLTVFAVSASASDTFTAKVDPRGRRHSPRWSVFLTLGVAAAVGAMRRVVRIDSAAATARLAGGGLA